MKKAVFLTLFVVFAVQAQEMSWAWVAGSSSVNLGPSYNAPADPGSRSGCARTLDAQNNLWIFGGYLFADGNYNKTNDLWKFDGTNWNFVSGSTRTNIAGVYGTLGTGSGTNSPGSRADSLAFTDSLGALWMFGGTGFGVNSARGGALNDLWKYSQGMWTWISGNSTFDVENLGNLPGGRYSAGGWMDSRNFIYVFGGYYGACGDVINDFWKFNGSWNKIGGDSLNCRSPGVYGTIRVGAIGNIPGARALPSTWVDSMDALWMFGGAGIDSQATEGSLNDLWRFQNGMWTWITGSNTVDHMGYYGTIGVPSSVNTPSTRSGAAYTVDKSKTKFYLFGGQGIDGSNLNDLWTFNGGNWAWISGTNASNVNPSYGIKGTSSVSNYPGSRAKANMWIDSNNYFYIFGGTNKENNYFNDMFRSLAIPTTSGALTSSVVTSSRLTTSPVTSSPVTSARLTTRPLTTSPLTTRSVSTGSLSTARVTSSPVTSSPVTSARLTTSPLTTRALTTARLTTSPLTTVPIYTTSPLTTRALTTSRLTTSRLTTSPLTTVPLFTTSPLTTRALTTSPVTSQAVTSAPVTSSPLTTRALTTRALTTRALTTRGLTTSPLFTTALSTTDQLSTGELTSNEITSAPLTTNDLSTAEITTQELTSNEMTTQELTTNELTTADVTTNEITTFAEVNVTELTTVEATLQTTGIVTSSSNGENQLSTTSSNNYSEDKSSNAGMIAGIIIGLLAVAALVAVLITVKVLKSRKSSEKRDQIDMNTVENNKGE